MSDPIDFKTEKERRARATRPGGRAPWQTQRWVTLAIIAAAVVYTLLRAWQALGADAG